MSRRQAQEEHEGARPDSKSSDVRQRHGDDRGIHRHRRHVLCRDRPAARTASAHAQIKSRAVGDERDPARRSCVTRDQERESMHDVTCPSDQTALAGKPGPAGPPGASRRQPARRFQCRRRRSPATRQLPKAAAPNRRLDRVLAKSCRLCSRSQRSRGTPGGDIVDPGPGQIVVAIEGDRVAVETYDAAGAPESPALQPDRRLLKPADTIPHGARGIEADRGAARLPRAVRRADGRGARPRAGRDGRDADPPQMQVAADQGALIELSCG